MARIGELLGPNQEVIHPQTSASVVYLEDGRSVEQVLSDDIDHGNVVFQESSYKFSSDVEDDFAKTVVIKGQTYQNILPEPSTHVLSSNKEIFKVNEGLDPNVEIVDGVSKSAILSGQTLVNLVSGMNTIGTNAVFKDGYITLTQKSYEYLACYITFSYPLTEGKKYLLVMDVKENTLGEIFRTTTNSCIGSGKTIVSNGSTGIVKYIMTITGGDNLGRITLRTNTGDFSGSITFKPMILEYVEGMENWDIPYFEGMQSVQMPVLTTTGKNLWNGEYENGYISPTDGYIPQTTDVRTTKWIKCKPNTTYICNSTSRNRWVLKGVNGVETVVGGVIGNETPTVTTLSDTTHLRCYYKLNGHTVENIQIEEGTSSTTYEPYKTNILHTPEKVVLRSLPNGVCDTLNLMTGEYVQRIGEITFKNQTTWEIAGGYPNLYYYNINDIGNANIYVGSGIIPNLYCDKVAVTSYSGLQQSTSGVKISNRGKEGTHSIAVYNGDITNNVVDFKAWLTQNPFTVQYELATPVVKTIDLSSSGNWEKVVLDGSEDEVWHNGDSSWANKIFRLDGARHTPNIMNSANALVETGLLFSSHFEEKGMNHLCNVKPQPEGVSIYGDSIFVGSPQISTIGELRTWLSQNPLTVWYQTKTHLDSTQVKQPIFFKDGHIQLSSGVDNSLIPTLDYQAKTSNSYVMDLMKANTHYTMKAKSASGTFTIDGTSYGAGTNGTFTTPSSMTNKLLVMSNKTNKEVMILEGDVVSKTIPYFKGIKSALEDESKIEVLSQGKNLFDISRMNEKAHAIPTGVKNIIDLANNTITTTNNNNNTSGYGYIITNLKPNTPYLVTVTNDIASTGVANFNIGKRDGTSWHEQRIGSIPIGATKSRIVYADNGKLSLSINVMTNGAVTLKNIQIEEVISANAKSTTYEPYKSNKSKIPLLSPLRSLPNGVCDELIIDRMKKKATLIQRVGICKFDSKDKYDCRLYIDGDWATNNSTGLIYRGYTPKGIDHVENESGYHICNSLTTSTRRGISSKTDVCVLGNGQYMGLKISNDKIGYNGRLANDYLSKNPVVVYYQLATPVITEVDLEGFPYIYKDGHIFLNGEITPTVGIEYSINQGHRISSQVETLQRHEQQFTKLERYFADLVHSDYNFALLRFSEKLHQQEGDV